MNNSVEKLLFGIFQGKVATVYRWGGKCTRGWWQIFSGFNTQKSLKTFNFWQCYLQNKKVDVFWDTVYIKVWNTLHMLTVNIRRKSDALTGQNKNIKYTNNDQCKQHFQSKDYSRSRLHWILVRFERTLNIRISYHTNSTKAAAFAKLVHLR